MSSNHTNSIRKRSDRVSRLDLPPSHYEQTIAVLRRGDVLSRIVICFFAATIMWGITKGWEPAMTFRRGQTPARDVVSRVDFEQPDPVNTKEDRNRARRSVENVYDHNPQPLVQLRQGLKDDLFKILSAKEFGDVDKTVWSEFHPNYVPATAALSNAIEASLPDASASDAASGDATEVESRASAAALADSTLTLTAEQKEFITFTTLFADDPELELFMARLRKAFEKIEKYGLLESLDHDFEEGSQTEITVRLPDEKLLPSVSVSDVRIAEATKQLKSNLARDLQSAEIARYVYNWLGYRLPVTLKRNEAATKKAADAAAAAVPDVMIKYDASKDVLAEGGVLLDAEHIALLEAEHSASVADSTWIATIARAMANFGMYVALYLLCGIYLYYRQPELISNLRRFIMLQGLILVTLTMVWLFSHDNWQAELIPLALFGMIAAISYRQEVALLLTAAFSLLIVLAFGMGLAEFVLYSATLAATVLLLRHIRSRTKLIYVGLTTAAVAFLTSLGVGIVSERVLGLALLNSAGWSAFLVVLSGLLMTGLLPFVESVFDVQTEISLLELGDVAHPLLQELVRRAPGTYNHSINVASLAEAAAESIGANGLLLRVGAYFHDIGKMLKPQYFVENQGTEDNRHETLLPAMSTLIIIAHVKDGADLARQHHLPQPLIDFILQHHGTTLVEYFYRRASQQSAEDPDATEVDEGSYRYPGPKPQTREAGVLMLSDSVESAARSLTDPAPARIESLVHDIAMKKLMDGQFDECGLTLQELNTVEETLIKSLAAMYHGRVKYPDQQPA